MITKTYTVVVLFLTLLVSGCGDDTRLLSIQARPVAPNILEAGNNVYTTSGATVQYQIVGWYSNNSAQTIATSKGKWSSTQPLIATVDSNGLAMSVGPVGTTQIVVTVGGHTSETELTVCDSAGCP